MGTSSVPNKLITYLAVGKPVLCAVPAGSEIARLVGEQQIGGVVEPGSPEALARGLKELRGKGRTALREMGARARRVALERYSLQAALRAFDAVLAEIGLPSASAAS
jgi:glycosyltransferase involved in cell wall biosynthesis